MEAIEVRKGSTMFRPTIVTWLVLLVLALNVVAFVTRIVDKCRLANRRSKSSERALSFIQSSTPVMLKGSPDPADAPAGVVSFTPGDIGASTINKP
jgi:hypothetical protein